MPWAPEGYTEAISIGDLLLRTAERHPDSTRSSSRTSASRYAELASRRADRPRPDRRRPAAGSEGRLPDGQQRRDRRDVLRDRAGRRRDRPDQHPLPGARAAVRDLQRRAGDDRHERPHRRLRRPARRCWPRRCRWWRSDRRSSCSATRAAPDTIGRAEFDAFADSVSEHDLDERRLRVKVGALAVLLFTSGTTSQPRACMLSHEALVRNWTTFGNVFRLRRARSAGRRARCSTSARSARS